MRQQTHRFATLSDACGIRLRPDRGRSFGGGSGRRRWERGRNPAVRCRNGEASPRRFDDLRMFRGGEGRTGRPAEGLLVRRVRLPVCRPVASGARACVPRGAMNGRFAIRGKNFNLCAHKLKFLPPSGVETGIEGAPPGVTTRKTAGQRNMT